MTQPLSIAEKLKVLADRLEGAAADEQIDDYARLITYLALKLAAQRREEIRGHRLT